MPSDSGPTDAHDDWIQETLGLDMRKLRADSATAAAATPPEQAPGGVISSLRDTATEAARTVAAGVARAAEGVQAAAKTVGKALGLIKEPVGPVGPMQLKRADAARAKLSADDQKKYQGLLDAAKTEKARTAITKGLASGHSVAELEAFAAKIAGKDDKWMQDNLSLTGDSQGKGIKQQWMMSCNATAVEAVRGELDPLYALKMHEDNPNLTQRDDNDGAKLNPKMAADQKALLETKDSTGYAGVALSVNKDTQHQGRWNTDLLNNVKDVTGVAYANKKIGEGGLTVDAAVDDIAKSADQKIPVPIVVGSSSTNYAHYVIVTASDPGPPRTFTIHDPANGTTETKSEDDLKGGKIDIAGPAKGKGYMKLSAYEKPTPVPVK
jgi:hypothetical protein